MLLFLIFCLLLFAVVLPNIFNTREKFHYSNEKRQEHAKVHYHEDNLADTIRIAPSSYYDNRSVFHNKLLGKKYRKLWSTEVTIPVFSVKDSIEKFWCHSLGGGDQTIKIRLEDNFGRIWALRSIDKDQSRALHPWLQFTFLRPLLRDETAAMNPYGAFIAEKLAQSSGILHTNPKLVFVPYIENLREDCRLHMAGRVALLEEEIDEPGWKGHPDFLNASELLKTDDMLVELEKDSGHSIDTLGFLKARLFDILINDWDRHGGQWVWALRDDVYYPIPMDRDMAFYLFDDGWLNRFLLLFNDKFTSFHPDYKNIKSYTRNSIEIDTLILGELEEEDFIEKAEELQSELTSKEIEDAFKSYPPEIYEQVGRSHIRIFKQRKEKIKIAANEFFAAIHEAN